MEPSKGNQKVRRRAIHENPASTDRFIAKKENNNAHRRELYATDVGYAAKTKKQSRETYRKDNPLPPSKVRNGLLVLGLSREVFMAEMDHPEYVVCYTLPETAAALGRTILTINKWIDDDLIPEPILKETTRNFKVYSEGELRVIARVLADHEREFQYYSVKHETTRHRMMQTVQAYRAQHL